MNLWLPLCGPQSGPKESLSPPLPLQTGVEQGHLRPDKPRIWRVSARTASGWAILLLRVGAAVPSYSCLNAHLPPWTPGSDPSPVKAPLTRLSH